MYTTPYCGGGDRRVGGGDEGCNSSLLLQVDWAEPEHEVDEETMSTVKVNTGHLTKNNNNLTTNA